MGVLVPCQLQQRIVDEAIGRPPPKLASLRIHKLLGVDDHVKFSPKGSWVRDGECVLPDDFLLENIFGNLMRLAYLGLQQVFVETYVVCVHQPVLWVLLVHSVQQL